MIIQGTAPVIVLDVSGADLTDKQVKVVIKTLTGETIEKSDKDIAVAGDRVAVFLTQDETIRIPEAGPCRVQLRWIGSDGLPGSTSMGYLDVDGIMDKSTMTYQEADA